MSSASLPTMRFTIKADQSGESLTIPADQSTIAILLLSLWLFGWTVSAIGVTMRAFQNFGIESTLTLLAWAVAWLAVAWLLAWLLTGREVLRFIGGDLEVTREIMGRPRRRIFAGREVQQISVKVPFRFPGAPFFPSPIRLSGNRGAVHFIYRGRNEDLAYGMNRHEANAIADWLRERLPNV